MFHYEKSTYEYSKIRRDFGRQPLFQIVQPHILDSIESNKEEQKLYILRNPVHRVVQATMPQSEQEVSTKQLIVQEQGINHTEGGWPRDVHVYNEDHIERYRRRVIHDDNYVHTVLSLTPAMKHYIDQNNAIDMYQTYFTNIRPQTPVEKYNIRTSNVFRDPLRRSISCIEWTNETNSKLAVSYCNYEHAPESSLTISNKCYLWDVSNPIEPIYTIEPEYPCCQLACSPVEPDLLVSGLNNGTVNIFDIRKGIKAIASSSIYNSHRNPISALLFTHSRTNTEFFTGSSDGQCLWWDIRNLSKPTDQLPMSIRIAIGEEPNLGNSESISCLEFDRGLPTKFLCGTETGFVINVNRMGRTHSEVLTSYWNAHSGPVRAVHRSPCTLRMFLTCGDWSVRIWSEEVRTAPIIVTNPYRHEVTDVAWAPLRYSSYMAICAGGVFYYWDILRKHKEPLATLKVSKHKLTRITPHVNGESVAVGDTEGSMFLLNLSENMVLSGANDKQLMYQTYERETKRENIFNTRVKEIRLKVRGEEATDTLVLDVPDEEELEEIAEKNYFKIVKDELRQMEITSTTSKLSIT